MDRKLWVRKLSNDKLLEIMSKVESFQICNKTDDEDLLNLAETWYNGPDNESLMALSLDVWKEAAVRWKDSFEKNI